MAELNKLKDLFTRLDTIDYLQKSSESRYYNDVLSDGVLEKMKEAGLVVFRPHMGDNDFLLEGAITALRPQPCFGNQPQSGDYREALEIRIDSKGFVADFEGERFLKAVKLKLYNKPEEWLDSWCRLFNLKDNRGWFVLFNLTDVPEVSDEDYEIGQLRWEEQLKERRNG